MNAWEPRRQLDKARLTGCWRTLIVVNSVGLVNARVPGALVMAYSLAWHSSAYGTRVYVTTPFSNFVSVIDTTSNIVVVVVAGEPFGVAITPDGTRAYVTNLGDDSVWVIDTASNSVVATVVVGVQPEGVAITPTEPAPM